MVWYGRKKEGDFGGKERGEDEISGNEGVGEGLLVGTGSRTKTTMAKTTMAGTLANEE